VERVELRSNEKGALGESLVFAGRSLPDPVSAVLFKYIDEHYETGDNPGFRTSIRRGVYFNATVSGKDPSWKSDARVNVSWASPEEQVVAQRKDLSYPKHDEEVSFALEVKTGSYAELERGQRDVAEAIAAADDRLHPVLVTVDITELPQSFHVDTKVLS